MSFFKKNKKKKKLDIILSYSRFFLVRTASTLMCLISPSPPIVISTLFPTQSSVFFPNKSKHALKLVSKEDIRSVTGKQDFAAAAPVNLIFVADYSRMDRVGDEKDFYAAVDTGFISQNVYLYCASEGLATVIRGWVDKKALRKAMNLGPEQRIVLAQTVGYPK